MIIFTGKLQYVVFHFSRRLLSFSQNAAECCESDVICSVECINISSAVGTCAGYVISMLWPASLPLVGLGRARAAMLQQPRVPPTGQRQAIEIAIKWREVLAQKEALLKIMSRHTGHSVDKLDKARALRSWPAELGFND